MVPMRRDVVMEWKLVGGGVDVGSTIGIVAATLGTGAGAGALEAVCASLGVVEKVDSGTTLGSGGGGGGSVRSGGTIGIGAGAVVGAVAVIVGELMSQSGEGVMIGTVGGAGISEASSAGGSVGT
jgi:hypothetical protein